MNLRTYFEDTKGLGVLSTADGEGRVNAAVYARPHVMDDGSLAFIMRHKRRAAAEDEAEHEHDDHGHAHGGLPRKLIYLPFALSMMPLDRRF